MKGRIEVEEMFAGSLEGNPLGDSSKRITPVYLPPGYDEGDRRYPVLYFLHAYTGSGLSWLNPAPFTRTVPERIEALIEKGTLPPSIAVFVDGWTSLGGSQWMNSEAIGRYRDYVAKDVVTWVDRTYRTIQAADSRALLGRSSGAYGALSMIRFHTDIFSHLAAHAPDSAFEYCYLHDIPKAASAILKAGGVMPWLTEFRQRAGATRLKGEDHDVLNVLAMSAAYSPRKGEPLGAELPFELPSGRLRTDVWNRWLVHDPVRFVSKHLDVYRRLRTLFFDCGVRDEYNLRWGTRLVVEELRRGDVDVIHEEFDDGHGGTNYRFERSLAVIGPKLNVKG